MMLKNNSILLNYNRRKKNMSKISEYAKEYQPQQTTKNIADLDKVSVDVELLDDDWETIDKVTKLPKIVKQKIIVVDEVNYRVPVTVIQQLKVLIEDNPELKNFKVKKSGSTKDDTRYQVIPVI